MHILSQNTLHNLSQSRQVPQSNSKLSLCALPSPTRVHCIWVLLPALPCAVLGADAAAKVEAAQRFVLQHARICVVSLGARGCIARARDGSVGRAPAGGVKVVDTIGAGDYFTSGFLYAHLMGCSLAQCAAVGCASGSEAVQVKGSILSEAAWQGLRARVDAMLVQQGQGGSSNGSAAADGAVARAAVVAAAQRGDAGEPVGANNKVDGACVLTAA